MRPSLAFAFGLVLAGTAALAHTGVKDPDVMARMNGMKAMAEHTKTLGLMARGTNPFDAAKAQAAIDSLRAETARIPVLFAPEADDPKSEALPTIWSDAAGFAKATEAMDAMLGAADVSSPEAISLTLRDMAQACSVCHESYREKN